MRERKDGITHVNIYSKGKTQLGRFLSNFTRAPIKTEDGYFESIEGYWYWLTCEDDRLRYVSGFEAKALGRQLGAQDWNDTEWFKAKIKDAIIRKITSNEKYLTMFRENQLPYDHYYLYGTRIKRPKECKWLMDFFNELEL